ncbi:2'-5' RNA ligase family protein [Rossellomorea marisflavi]|uniref:2'-5' RNA ligase family protein n=1 Tax=Rossellomorea marisflavi TaxID=189381 RepID=UPI003D2CA399
MKKEYFIGIVPPEEYLERVQQFQNRWMGNVGVELHITLKAQGGLSPDRKWLDEVKGVASRFRPFSLSLGEPAYFGEAILYLTVHSRNLFDLHREIVQAVSPSPEEIRQYFELEAFVPHLTLGKELYPSSIRDGVGKTDLGVMEQQARRELAPYPRFGVTSIRVYELNTEKKQYEPLIDLPLRTV